jgi:predicted transcriptional regulator
VGGREEEEEEELNTEGKARPTPTHTQTAESNERVKRIKQDKRHNSKAVTHQLT